jgi:hypothetical protein
MLNKIKLFLNYLDLALSKSFFGSQSIVRKVLRDRFYAIIRRDVQSSEFRIVRGRTPQAELPNFDDAKTLGLGNRAAEFSRMYFVEDLNDTLKQIILAHQLQIKAFLGEGFLYSPTLYFRTLSLPPGLDTFDVYSNVWHLDSHEGERSLKIFICLMDVGADDGPFMYLDRVATLKYWKSLVERWDFTKMAAVPHFPEEQFLIGPRGTYLIINTGTCMHRASIPKGHRDMMQVELYPSWCKSSNRRSFNLTAGL